MPRAASRSRPRRTAASIPRGAAGRGRRSHAARLGPHRGGHRARRPRDAVAAGIGEPGRTRAGCRRSTSACRRCAASCSDPPRREVPKRPRDAPIRQVWPRTFRDPRGSASAARRRLDAMRLATWNVNSVRARVDRIVDFAVRESVDVLAMQEIKCKAEQFPFELFEDAGYHVEAHGFSQWNGVAIASREPLTDVEICLSRNARLREGLDDGGRAAGGARDRRDGRRHPRLEPVRAQRPRARRPALLLQARLAERAAASTRAMRWRPLPISRSPSSATSTSRRRMPTTAIPPWSPASRPTSRRPSARRSRRSRRPA